MKKIKVLISLVFLLTVFSFGGFNNKASAQFDEETFKTPSNGRITSWFGPRDGRMHNGLDIANYLNNPIKAAARGVVTEVGKAGVGDKKYWGNYVIIKHSFGGATLYETVYAHLNSTAVTTGSSVTQGQVIGYEGNTGDSDGIHLHFEIHKNGVAINPAPITGNWLSSSGWYYKYLDGSFHKGWLKDNGTWYYLDSSSGAMKTGWVSVGTNWYFMDSSGAMQTGWLSEGGHWYYLSSSGAMVTGWQQVGGNWYFFSKTSGGPLGSMVTGWLQDGGYTYYLGSDGVMYTGTRVIDGETYTFNSSGQLQYTTTKPQPTPPVN